MTSRAALSAGRAVAATAASTVRPGAASARGTATAGSRVAAAAPPSSPAGRTFSSVATQTVAPAGSVCDICGSSRSRGGVSLAIDPGSRAALLPTGSMSSHGAGAGSASMPTTAQRVSTRAAHAATGHASSTLSHTQLAPPKRPFCAAAGEVIPPDVVKHYESFLTPKSLRRKPSAIRSLQPLLGIEGMISLGGGLPNSQLFPFKGVKFELKDGREIELSAEAVEQALQYSATPGLPNLVERLMHVQLAVHKPPPVARSRLSLSVTTGSQDALEKAFSMLLTHTRSVLVESPTYSGALAALQPLGAKLVGVDTDSDGLVPDSLESILDNWDSTHGVDGHDKPRVLYTIPTGSNPTGASISAERRRRIYAIACKHDLIILEDDPYYFLQYGPRDAPSFLSLDTEARVLRFDSFSKVLSSGLRVGFVTGPSPLLNRIDLHSQASALHSSGLSQAAVLALLQHWDVGTTETDDESQALGLLERHINDVSEFYRRRADLFCDAVDRHLADAGLVDYSRPTAGMFLWMRLHGVKDTAELIQNHAVKAKVLLVPGTAFMPQAGEASPFARAAFSTVPEDKMDVAVQRLAALLRGIGDGPE